MTMRNRLRSAIVALSLMVAAVVLGESQLRAALTKVGTTFRITGEAGTPAAAAFDSTHGVYLLVEHVGSPTALNGTFVSDDGETVGQRFTIAAAGAEVDAAYLADGDAFLVVWREVRFSVPIIVGRLLRFTPSGPAFLSGDLFLDRNIQTEEAVRPRVAGAGQEFLVVWADSGTTAFARFVSPTGTMSDEFYPWVNGRDLSVACNPVLRKCLIAAAAGYFGVEGRIYDVAQRMRGAAFSIPKDPNSYDPYARNAEVESLGGPIGQGWVVGWYEPGPYTGLRGAFVGEGGGGIQTFGIDDAATVADARWSLRRNPASDSLLAVYKHPLGYTAAVEITSALSSLRSFRVFDQLNGLSAPHVRRSQWMVFGSDTSAVGQIVETEVNTCRPTVSGLPAMADAAGQTGSFTLSVRSTCPWTATSNVAWFTMTPSSGMGPATVSYTVEPNPRFAGRSAVLRLNDYTYYINQAGASLAGSPGRPTLLWQNTTSGGLEAWAMSGTGFLDDAMLGPGRFSDLNWNLAGRGDFNRDGHTDLLFQHLTDGRLLALLMNGTSMTSSDFLVPYHEEDLDWRVVTVADMNGDRRPDLVWQNRVSRAIRLWLMNGLIRSDDPVVTPVPEAGWWLRTTADLDRDGFLDLVMQRVTDGAIEAWFLNGVSRSRVEALNFMPSDPAWTVVGAAPSALLSNQSDLILQNRRTGALQLWFMNNARVYSTAPMDSRPSEWKLDGFVMPGAAPASERPGLLVQQTSTGALTGWFLTGAELQFRRDFTPATWPTTGWHVAAYADFNGDTHNDVLWQHDTGALAMWLMGGTGVASAQYLDPRTPPNENWFVATAYDANGDGMADILWQNRIEGSLRVWFMNGATMTGTVLLDANRANDMNWRAVGAGDFDNDGDQDILWWHPLDGYVQVWFMDGTTLVSRDLTEPGRVADTNWRPVAVTDLDGNGTPDLVWHHRTNSSLQAWYMNGRILTDSVWMSPLYLPEGLAIAGGK